MKRLFVTGGLAALIAAAAAYGGPERPKQSRQAAPIFVRRLYVTVRETRTVACPRGWAAAAGGIDRSFASTRGATGSWVKGERAWVFRADTGARFQAFVTCIRSKPGVTFVWGSARRSVSAGSYEEWISCPRGQRPTGWGFDFRLASAGVAGPLVPPPRMYVSFKTMRPEPDGWEVGTFVSAARGEVRIRCLRPRTSGSVRYVAKTRGVGRTVSLGPRAVRQLKLRCPKGWLPLSPGWEAANPAGEDGIVHSFIAYGGAGTYRAQNITDEPHEVGIHLVCIRNVAQPAR